MRIKVIKTDETGDWSLAPEFQMYIKRVFGVSFFDPLRRVHCAEITPSYELEYYDFQIEWTDKFRSMLDGDDGKENAIWADKKRDEIEDILYAASSAGNVTYMHCHTVDAFPSYKNGWFPRPSHKQAVCTLSRFMKPKREEGETADGYRESCHDHLLEEVREFFNMTSV